MVGCLAADGGKPLVARAGGSDAKDLPQAARMIASAAWGNAGVPIDAFHLDRSVSCIDDMARIPRGPLHSTQFCDVPAGRASTTRSVLAEARAERCCRSQGGLDVKGPLRNLQREMPIRLDTPAQTLAQTMGAAERARCARSATRVLFGRHSMNRRTQLRLPASES